MAPQQRSPCSMALDWRRCIDERAQAAPHEA